MRFLSVIVGIALSVPSVMFAQTSTESSLAAYAVDQLTQLLLNLRQPTAEEIQKAFYVPESTGIAERLDLLLKNPALALLVASVATSTATTTEISTDATAIATPTDSETAALTAEIAAVQAEISALLASGGGSASTAAASGSATTAAIACPVIGRTLSYGSSGEDVTNLQLFLIEEQLLESGNATGFFGPLTQAAVQAWQAAKGIVSDGSPETTGWGVVGPRTRAALQNCR